MSSDERCPTRFDFGVRLGLVFVVEMACLSAIASTALLAYIGVRSFFSLLSCNADVM